MVVFLGTLKILGAVMPKRTSHVLPVSHAKVLVELRMSKSITKPGLLEKANITYLGCAQQFFSHTLKRAKHANAGRRFTEISQGLHGSKPGFQVWGQWPHCHLLSTLPAWGLLQGSSGFGVSLLSLDVACIQQSLPAQEEKMHSTLPSRVRPLAGSRSGSPWRIGRHLPSPKIRLCPQIMKEVRRALCNAATDDSKLLLLSAVGSVFCSGLDYSYLIGRLSSDRRKESTRIAEAIRWALLVFGHFGNCLLLARCST